MYYGRYICNTNVKNLVYLSKKTSVTTNELSKCLHKQTSYKILLAPKKN